MYVQCCSVRYRYFVPRFKDICRESWYSKYVLACYLNGIMFGADEVYFEPDSYITVLKLTESISRIAGIDAVNDDSFITREAISLMVGDFYGESY